MAGLALIGLSVGCGSAAKDDRQKVLRATTDEVIVPSLNQLRDDTEALETAVSQYCSNPTPDGLAAPQVAWRAARESYKLTSSFQIGPSEQLATAVDFWPVREADIEKGIGAAPAIVRPSYLNTLGVSAKGFAALEYLLFREPLELTATPNGLRRCSYALGLAADVSEQARLAHEAWIRDGFAENLANPGEGSATIASSQAAIDRLLNSTAAALVDLTDKTLARPLGEKSGGVAQPGDCESRYASGSSADYLAALRSVRRLWVGALEGDRGRGLTLLVRRYDIPTDTRVRSAIDDTSAQVQSLEIDICGAVTTDQAGVVRALESARKLRRLMTTEVVQVMGGTLSFSDNDGD